MNTLTPEQRSLIEHMLIDAGGTLHETEKQAIRAALSLAQRAIDAEQERDRLRGLLAKLGKAIIGQQTEAYFAASDAVKTEAVSQAGTAGGTP